MKKQYAFVLPSGLVCGQTATTWNDSDLSGNPPFLVSSAVSVLGYQDITSIENWGLWGQNAGADYLQTYKEIATLAYIKTGGNWANWGLLTGSEKETVARFCAAPYPYRLQVFSDAQDAANYESLVEKTRVIRGFIVERMRRVIADYLRIEVMTKQESDQFYIDTQDLLLRYQFTNNNGFKQWLTNEAGSIYEFDGFAQKSYYTLERKDKLCDIVVNLNY